MFAASFEYFVDPSFQPPMASNTFFARNECRLKIDCVLYQVTIDLMDYL